MEVLRASLLVCSAVSCTSKVPRIKAEISGMHAH